MKFLTDFITKIYIKNSEPLPDDIYESILNSFKEDRWENVYETTYYNIQRGLSIKFKNFLSYLVVAVIPRSRYYIDRERSLVLLKAMVANTEKYRLSDLDKLRTKLKDSLEKGPEIDENGRKKEILPGPRITF